MATRTLPGRGAPARPTKGDHSSPIGQRSARQLVKMTMTRVMQPNYVPPAVSAKAPTQFNPQLTRAWKGEVLVIRCHGLLTENTMKGLREYSGEAVIVRHVRAVVLDLRGATLAITVSDALESEARASDARILLCVPVGIVVAEADFRMMDLFARQMRSTGMEREAFSGYDDAMTWAASVRRPGAVQ